MIERDVLMKRKTHKEFINEINKKNPTIIVRGTYINCNTKIEVECSKCGYVWNGNPTPLLQGHGCPKCANNIKKTTNDFATELQDINPYIKIIDEYKNAVTPIKVKCCICENEWRAKPARLLNGAQCMNCIKPHTSFMEQFILLALQSILGNDSVKSRDTSAIGQELDIFIPKHRLAIEPGSWLYHENKVNDMDSTKRDLCHKKGIRLITIYDTYPDGLKPPYDTDCFVFTGFLNEYGYKRLRKLVIELFSMIGHTEISIDWNDVSHKAYEACHYNAHETFISELKSKYPNIEVLDDYKGSNIPILVNNTDCEHPAWIARPYTLLKGIGCPECGRLVAATNRKRTHEEFICELQKISPSIKVNGTYTRITDRIVVECLNCGYKWNPFGYSLIQGKGCPHCSAITGAKNRKGKLSVKTTEDFTLEIAQKNPSIEICGEYKNNKTKIAAKCKNCGYEWDVAPASLLNGHSCPKCARKRKSDSL